MKNTLFAGALVALSRVVTENGQAQLISDRRVEHRVPRDRGCGRGVSKIQEGQD